MSRANRKRARRKLQAGRAPRESGGHWVVHTPTRNNQDAFWSNVARESELKKNATSATLMGGAT